MRRAARVDANQPAIVAALRAAGCDVQDLSKVGNGVPDLLVQRAGVIYLLEAKRPAGPQGGLKGRLLTEKQIAFRQRWPVHTVRSPHEALHAVGLIR